MLAAKEISLIGIFVALLVGGQWVLSGVSGIEIVTVLLLSFAFYFGIRRGLIVATAFSLLRCFIFGFFPNVIILYLIYYNLFVVVFGLLGKKFNRSIEVKRHIVIIAVAVAMTVFFTLLDNLISTFYFSFTWEVAKRYCLLSLTALVPQLVCTLITVLLLLPILIKLYAKTFK